MIIDPQTGKIVLERLSGNVRVKNVRMENRPTNPTMKSTVPRVNNPEPQTEKKLPKTATKPTTQKPTIATKPVVNAPVKPMPHKKAPSPMDDRLSDEECKILSFIFTKTKIFFFKLHLKLINLLLPLLLLHNQLFYIDVNHIQHLVSKKKLI